MNELQITFLYNVAYVVIGVLVGALVNSIMMREHEKCKSKKQEPYKHIRAQFNLNEMDALRLIRSGKLTDSKHCPELCKRFEACGMITGGASWGHTINLRLTETGKMFLTAYDEE